MNWWKGFNKGLTPWELAKGVKFGWDSGYFRCLGEDMFPFKGPAAVVGTKFIEEVTTHAAEASASKAAGAYYHFTDGRFTAWEKHSKVLAPRAAETISAVIKFVNGASWAFFDYELLSAVYSCAGKS